MNPSKKPKYEVLSDSDSDSDTNSDNGSESTNGDTKGGAAKPKGPIKLTEVPEENVFEDILNPKVVMIFLKGIPSSLKKRLFDWYDSCSCPMDLAISDERVMLYAVINEKEEIVQAWSLSFAMEFWKHQKGQGIALKHPGPYPWKRSDNLYADLFTRVCEEGCKSWLSTLFLEGFSKIDYLIRRRWVNALLSLNQTAFKSFYRVCWRTLPTERHLLFPKEPFACVVFRNIQDPSSEWICFVAGTNLGPPNGTAPLIYKNLGALNQEDFEDRHKGLFVTQLWLSKFYWDNDTKFNLFLVKPNQSPCAMPTHAFCTVVNNATNYRNSVILGADVYLASADCNVVKLDLPYKSDENTILSASGTHKELILVL